jgi:hypothetical protein
MAAPIPAEFCELLRAATQPNEESQVAMNKLISDPSTFFHCVQVLRMPARTFGPRAALLCEGVLARYKSTFRYSPIERVASFAKSLGLDTARVATRHDTLSCRAGVH